MVEILKQSRPFRKGKIPDFEEWLYQTNKERDIFHQEKLENNSDTEDYYNYLVDRGIFDYLLQDDKPKTTDYRSPLLRKLIRGLFKVYIRFSILSDIVIYGGLLIALIRYSLS